MIRAALLVAAACAVACGPKTDVHTYDNSLFQLAAGFRAKEMCSCVFVMGRTEDDCKEWTKVSPNVASFTVDRDRQQVRSTALGMGRTVATFDGAELGCSIAR